MTMSVVKVSSIPSQLLEGSVIMIAISMGGLYSCQWHSIHATTKQFYVTFVS